MTRWTLPAFLDRLGEIGLNYTIGRYRELINVMVSIPWKPERWEVEFMDDGTIQVERFQSAGEIGNGGWLEDLFRIAHPSADAD